VECAPLDRCTADGVDAEKGAERELGGVGGAVVTMGGCAFGLLTAWPHTLQ